MTINSIGSEPSYTSSSTSASQTTLGKDEFLHLLVTQLQNQDPLNPMDSTAFTAQLAEFSSLEQLHNVNTNLEALQVTQAGIENSQAVTYIGKQVMASGQTVQMADGEAQNLHFTLGRDAAAIYINLYNAAGQYVRGIEEGARAAGNQAVRWDGADSNGNILPDGVYSFEVLAVDGQNQMVPVATYTTGLVRGVTFQSGAAYLLTDSQEIPLSAVLQVTNADTVP
jgi:flagellar basal-body rod modification protein FlgD